MSPRDVPTAEFDIRVAATADRPSALQLVFNWESSRARHDRIQAMLDAGQTDRSFFACLLEAWSGDRRSGAIWGQIAGGRVANVWPAGLVEGESETTADALQAELDFRLQQSGVACGQALLPVSAQAGMARLRRNGYQEAARLVFLGADESQFPAELPVLPFAIETFREDQRERLERVIEQTYEGTLDAPVLNGVRATEDVIDGYRLSGLYSPDRWFFVRHQGCDVGCLLLTLHGERGPCELVYMGLVPAARGQGWGECLARYAQWCTRQYRARTLVLGVDGANDPAIRSYLPCGFHHLDERWAYVKSFVTAR